MKEIRSRIERPPIRRLSGDDLFRELYRIACYFYASKHISSSEDEVELIPALQMLAEEVEEREIVGALLNASIRMRLLDEQLWDFSEEIKKQFACVVGSLWESSDTTTPEDLSLREACNKILHANDIGFFVDDTEYRPEGFAHPRFLEPKLALYGRRGRVSWRSEVAIDKFVEGGYWLARFVGND